MRPFGQRDEHKHEYAQEEGDTSRIIGAIAAHQIEDQDRQSDQIIGTKQSRSAEIASPSLFWNTM